MERVVLKYVVLNYPPLLLDNIAGALEEFATEQPTIVLIGENVENVDSRLDEKDFDLFLIHLDFMRWQNKKYDTPINFMIAIRRHYPGTRIMISMSGGTVYFFRELYTRIHPQCIVDITDCTPTTLTQALTHLVQNETYYSKAIFILFQRFIKANEFLDSLDYAILYELSLGTPIKELPRKIFLSLTTIYKRRKMLKIFFDVDEQSDKALLIKARQLGYI